MFSYKSRGTHVATKPSLIYLNANPDPSEVYPTSACGQDAQNPKLVLSNSEQMIHSLEVDTEEMKKYLWMVLWTVAVGQAPLCSALVVFISMWC